MNRFEDASTLPLSWWKSSASAAQSDCVECAVVAPERVAVRDSKKPTGPALLLTRDQFVGLVTAVKSGKFAG
ncbi:DUF397 domain-containing protein [Streptomyces albus]|uniref:DUF397 domain-containing protein n=1 Tax=Streptomyces albus TaxID=1888 RepID=A0A6C1C424_9ACTN|nr:MULTISPECIES: DUF397 domain-containing protein [Streptomyces]EPD91104.1 hypothetical protein HMPREF1486_05491 [Streptomyces sp. HPH0547]QID36990.1 DUF397 domain-containing protein [Streptomyces albus]TGG88092.1 DUF397 domain-containing protein [Streptomyces albus]UVN56087.1 DUF397 domain-containing protein [Streptomyces albus]GHJ22802.1 hypothetical protein TPA0909_44160 [Streptomyces albus]